MSRKYKFANPESAYFVSFATVNWVDLFTREIYLEILADSLTYCRKNKGIELYAYVFMPNPCAFGISIVAKRSFRLYAGF